MEKPLLIFDGNCGFCRIWIDYWIQLTGDRVNYAPSQEVGPQYPQIPKELFSKSVHFVRPDGSYVSGAEAVFETLDKSWIYDLPLVAPITEWGYRIVAARRNLFYQITRFTFGRHVNRDRFALTQWVFLKLLAVIYAIAFASLAVQVTGLIGENGIAPARDFFSTIAASLGMARFYALPSLFWFTQSDLALKAGCWIGVAIAALLAAGYFQRAALAILYILYLSYSLAGQIFMGYQWDALLLEAGFLALFFGNSETHQRKVAWLFRLLAFRLYFLSGWVKLSSGDPNWRNLSALGFHYHTQPLPTIFAWYFDKLPPRFQHFSTAAVLGIEIAVPFLIFAPRCWRHVGAWMLLAVQLLIFITGNYTFFNLLTMAITIFLFDDRAFERIIHLKISSLPQTARRLQMAGTWLLVLIGLLGGIRIWEPVFGSLARVLAYPSNLISQFQVVNSYGLFAIMTTSRPEIIVEGSEDGENWLAYEFRYKPGDVLRPPRWAQPHQPRLDWQMWFAALDEDYRASPWFPQFLEKLLRAQPEVLGLLETNPFPDKPPKYVRARLFDYTFTTSGESGWWKRRELKSFFPAVSLR